MWLYLIYIKKKKKEEKQGELEENIKEEPKEITNFGNIDLTSFESVDPGYIICPKCGQKMREDYKQCFVCGMMFNKKY